MPVSSRENSPEHGWDKWCGVLQKVAVSLAEEGHEPDENVDETLVVTATGESGDTYYTSEAQSRLKLAVPLVCVQAEVSANTMLPSSSPTVVQPVYNQNEKLWDIEPCPERAKLEKDLQVINHYDEQLTAAAENANLRDLDSAALMFRKNVQMYRIIRGIAQINPSKELTESFKKVEEKLKD